MPSTLTKQPSENYPLALQYYGNLPVGTSLSSAALSAIDLLDDSDATNIVLASPTGTISGTQVLFRVQGGATGKNYKITCLATLSDGSILEDEITLTVTET